MRDIYHSVCVDENLQFGMKSLFEPLAPEFAKSYKQFFDEYLEKDTNEIESIQNGKLRLYAVDKSTEVQDWTKVFDLIEAAYPAFWAICEKPKSHLRSINEVRPIETVKRVGYESIAYLAAHSEDWLTRTVSGLKPARLFSRIEDDDYEIYENRVVKTLIDFIISFLRRTERSLKESYAQLESIMNSDVQTGSFGFDVTFQKAIAELIQKDDTADEYRTVAMELAEKFAKRAKMLLKKYMSLCNSMLYKRLKKARTVSNPLNETNILLFDKHYSVVFKLWKSTHKVLVSKKYDKEKNSLDKEDPLLDKYYKQFCKTLIEYAVHVLGFDIESDGKYIRNDNICIEITDDNDWISVYIQDITEHELVISGGVALPILAGQRHDKFRYDGKKLYWDCDISQEDIENFSRLLKQNGKTVKEQNEQRRNYIELKKLISEREHEYPKEKKFKLIVFPCTIELKNETRNSFKNYMKEKANHIRVKAEADMAIIALPKCQENEQKITDYAFEDNEKLMFLPLSMYDINSFRRIQNAIIRQIITLEKDTCPCCGLVMRKDENQAICDSCRGLILTTTICPEDDCKCQYQYMGYIVSEDTISKMKSVDETNFFQKDSLYQYKNIVKMSVSNHKIITKCPYCGR